MQLVQILMFRELVNVRYSARKFEDVPLFRTTQWGWFYTCMLYSYGQAFYINEKVQPNSQPRRARAATRAVTTHLRHVRLTA